MLYAKARGGICLLDADGRIVDANPALLALLRRDLLGVVGRRVADFVAPDWVDGVAASAAAAWHAEFPLVDAAGMRVHVEWSVSPFVQEGHQHRDGHRRLAARADPPGAPGTPGARAVRRARRPSGSTGSRTT